MSAMVTCLSLCWAAKRAPCSPFITLPSSFISSLMTPTGGRPESLQRSTAASVWPERMSTPPSLAISGKMWPGRTKSAAPMLLLASARTVLVRCSAEMPVVSPWRTSTDTVKAVPSGASFEATIGSRRRRRASAPVRGAQTMPQVLRMMNAILSGVQSEAATMRSPSFSRSSSSVTMTISPAENASTASVTLLAMALSLERPAGALADLAPVAQVVIREHARHHGLADRDGPDADAWVVAALRHDLRRLAVAGDGRAGREDRGGGLHGEAAHDGLAGRDAAQDAAGVVRSESRRAAVAGAHLVG